MLKKQIKHIKLIAITNIPCVKLAVHVEKITHESKLLTDKVIKT